MSASAIFSPAAPGRPFIFSPPSSAFSQRSNVAMVTAKSSAKSTKNTAQILAHVGASPRLAAVVPASRLEVHPAPAMVSSGIPQLDSLTGGLARGCLTEICGAASSGRTSILLFALARATERGEVCALVDASDAFDPASAAAAGMEMNRLLWVRCGEKYPSRKPPSSVRKARSGELSGDKNRWFNAEGRRWEAHLVQMLKVTDLLLQSNGFGMIALDLSDVPVASARRIPLASWFRFRRAVEHTSTVLLVLERQPIAGSCSSALIKVATARSHVAGEKLSAISCQPSAHPPMHAELSHTELLDGFEITAELLRSRLGRKPAQSTRASFRSRAAWAG